MGAYDPYDLSIDEVFTNEEPAPGFGKNDLSGTMCSAFDSLGKEFCFLIPDDLPHWLEERMADDPNRIEIYERSEERSLRTHVLVDVVSLDRSPTLEDLRRVSELWIESRNRDIS